MNPLKKQLGFALPMAILIAVVLILAGGVGYYFYIISQEQKEAEGVKPEQIIDETADWKTYLNEKYDYEIKYPKDWSVQEIKTRHPVEENLMVEYVKFDSPNKNYFLVFSLRNKGGNIPFTDRTGVGGGDFAKGDTVKIGGVDVQTTNLVYGGKIQEVFYPSAGTGGFGIDGFEGRAEFRYREYSENLDMKNLPELKTANQILSTFKFSEVLEEDKIVQISVFTDKESFDLENKTFEGWWASKIEEKTKVKIITTDSTEFYRTSEPTWEKEYLTFSELYFNTSPTWPLTVKGIFEKEGVIKASEVFIIVQ